MQRLRRYRWALIILGLHTAFIGFAFIKGKHAPLVWAYPICLDFPVTLLVFPVLDLFLKQLAVGAATREFILAGTMVVVGGAQWFALTAMIGSRLRRAQRQDGNSSCLHCGYNLTGNVSGVCPECGQRVELVARSI